MHTALVINTLHDLLEAVKYAEDNLKTDLWWRGHAVAKWKLVPGVYRERGDALPETTIVYKFMLQAKTRHDKCPPRDAWDNWLFFMQHYRLPTRLLDWTESSLVASYFAVFEHPSEAASLWVISPALLNQSQGGAKLINVPTHEDVWPLFKAAFLKVEKEPDTILPVAPEQVDLRMLVQSSAFTIHGTETPIEDLSGNDQFLIRFDIPASAKPGIKKDLLRLNIRESTLYPDLEHLAKDIASLKMRPPGT